MTPDRNMKLADLMYGHGSEFMCSLSGRFSHEKYPDAPPIQICEMKCGCWIVADGNNRVGLILKKNPDRIPAPEWRRSFRRRGARLRDNTRGAVRSRHRSRGRRYCA